MKPSRILRLATLCYLQRGGKTLMMHRVKRPDDMHYGKWNGLGGKFQPGETPEECVVREVREESGLRLFRPRLRGLLAFPGFNGEDDWHVFVFTARRFSGRLRAGPEGALAWIDNRKLFSLPLWPGDLLFLKWLKGRRFFSGKFVYKNQKLRSHRVTFYGR